MARRIERLEYIEAELKVYARSERAVPTAYAAPLLEKLRPEVEQLQKVLESDLSRFTQWPDRVAHPDSRSQQGRVQGAAVARDTPWQRARPSARSQWAPTASL